MQTPLRQPRSDFPVTAFTLTELLVVIAVLALLATTQLPALTRAKAPVKFTQCQNNLRQIGQATLIYKDENNDAFPYGSRIRGTGDLLDPTGWPMQLLHYLGGYKANVQPIVYVCPCELRTASGWAFQVHYAANRNLLSDVDDLPQAIFGYQVRRPAMFWAFIEKSPAQFCNIRSGSLGVILSTWNYPPGSPEMRRHNGGTSSVAADGHVEWLRMPPYQPDAPPPSNLLELGDCANGQNPASSWLNNGNRVKLFSRYKQSAGGAAF